MYLKSKTTQTTIKHDKILSNFLLLRYLKSYICNSVAELRINLFLEGID